MAIKSAIKACLPQRLEKIANQANATVEHTVDGRYVARSRSTRQVLATKNTEEELKTFLKDLTPASSPHLDASNPYPARTEAAAVNPPAIGAQLTSTRKVVKALQISIGAVATPIHQLARNVELLTGYKASTVIVEPLRKARVLVDELKTEVRDSLAKRSYQKVMHDMSLAAANLSKEQQRLITLMPEAMTKNEVAQAGRFLSRAMTPDEIDFANMIPKSHVEDIPLYIRRNVLIDSFLHNRGETLDHLIPQTVRAIQEGKLPGALIKDIEGFQANATKTLEELRAVAGVDGDIAALHKALGMTDDEIMTSGFIRLMITMQSDDFNIPAIYRYATAPELKPGFKTGVEQFVAERGMEPFAAQLASQRIELLRESFKGSGYNADQVLFGQLPVFRALTDVGLWSGKEWGRAVRGMPFEGKALNILNSLEEGSAVLSRRVLSGHINPRELDPILTADRHITNMLLREHFDPLLPAAKDLAKEIFNNHDERIGKWFVEYINDIDGLPSGKFEAVNGMFRSLVREVGWDVDERIAERFVNMMVRISSQATLPFRVGAVARNSTQSPFLGIPVMGLDAWKHGTLIAMGKGADGFNYANHLKAIRRSVKAGAIDPNILPIHASSEVFNTQFEALSKAGIKYKDFFDFGFTLYRTPDDIGRVAAFEGQHHLIRNAGDIVNGRVTLEQFAKNARLNQFDELIQQEGFQMIRDVVSGTRSMDEVGDFFGRHLADKIHFLYAHASHPPGWGGVAGRVFGQFGTFPVQYLNYVLENGTRNIGSREWAEFVAVHGALNMGIVKAGSEFFDADLTSWNAMGSIFYGGGPYAEGLISLAQMWSGSDAERSLAWRNLQMMLPTIGNPRSIIIPGSNAAADIIETFQADSFEQALGEFAGFRFLRPGEKTYVDKALGWIEEIR